MELYLPAVEMGPFKERGRLIRDITVLKTLLLNNKEDKKLQ